MAIVGHLDGRVGWPVCVA